MFGWWAGVGVAAIDMRQDLTVACSVVVFTVQCPDSFPVPATCSSDLAVFQRRHRCIPDA